MNGKASQIKDPISPCLVLATASLLCMFSEDGLPQDSYSLLISEDQRGKGREVCCAEKKSKWPETNLWKYVLQLSKMSYALTEAVSSEGYTRGMKRWHFFLSLCLFHQRAREKKKICYGFDSTKNKMTKSRKFVKHGLKSIIFFNIPQQAHLESDTWRDEVLLISLLSRTALMI